MGLDAVGRGRRTSMEAQGKATPPPNDHHLSGARGGMGMG